MTKVNREDYQDANGIASWWQKDGAWHICVPNTDGELRWTADQYRSRDEAIAAMKNANAG